VNASHRERGAFPENLPTFPPSQKRSGESGGNRREGRKNKEQEEGLHMLNRRNYETNVE